MKKPVRMLALAALTMNLTGAARTTAPPTPTETLTPPTTPTTTTLTPSTSVPADSSDLIAPTPTKSKATTSTSSSGAASPTGVKCSFRYVLPTASNIAGEISKEITNDSSSSSNGTGSGSGLVPSHSGLESGQGSSVGDVNGTSHKTHNETVTPLPGGKSSLDGSASGAGTGATTKPTTGLNVTRTPQPSPTLTPVPSKTNSKTTTEPTTSPTSTSANKTRVLIEYTDLDTPSINGASGSLTGPGTLTSPTNSTPKSTNATPTEGLAANKSTKVVGEFACDAAFYGAWLKMGLKCGDTDLDVSQAVAQTQCLIYSGTKSDSLFSDVKSCFSMCKIPGCDGTAWDYTATNGMDSSVYKGLNLMELLRNAGATAAVDGAPDGESQFSNVTMHTAQQCVYGTDKSFESCQCPSMLVGDNTQSRNNRKKDIPSSLTVPQDKGKGDFSHWPDGQQKSALDQAGIATTSFGGAAAGVSVAVGGAVTVAGGVGGAVGGTAGGLSATAGSAMLMATIDMCHFGVMVNQLNLNARPRVLEYLGKKLAPSAFSFLPFGKANQSQQDQKRRLADGSAGAKNQKEGMERYAELIGVQVDQLFYVTLAGIACVFIGIFALYALMMLLCSFCVQDFGDFARRWFDKVVGVCLMIAILSQYAIGATATFAICYSIKMNRTDLCLFLAIFTLLFFAFGTILFGIVVIKRNEDELRDLGTKDHFEKRIHVRYGTLYDEYKFESRFFFAPKLLLALLCGCTAGVIWIQGQTQLIVLIGLHILFLFFLEVKQPYPSAFVHRTSSLVIVIKISVLFLSFFLMSSVTGLTKDIPMDLRQAIGFVIIGLQALVLVCLCVRQMYIFYQTWKLKRDSSSKAQEEQDNRHRTSCENFFAIPDSNGTLNQYGTRPPSCPMLGEQGQGRAPRPRRLDNISKRKVGELEL